MSFAIRYQERRGIDPQTIIDRIVIAGLSLLAGTVFLQLAVPVTAPLWQRIIKWLVTGMALGVIYVALFILPRVWSEK